LSAGEGVDGTSRDRFGSRPVAIGSPRLSARKGARSSAAKLVTAQISPTKDQPNMRHAIMLLPLLARARPDQSAPNAAQRQAPMPVRRSLANLA
jgi:hypothetical protein